MEDCYLRLTVPDIIFVLREALHPVNAIRQDRKDYFNFDDRLWRNKNILYDDQASKFCRYTTNAIGKKFSKGEYAV